ncbi:MAG TPA: Fic family protein [Candidatus Woesebacteria bacterium]|nr:Fic family protein [Candidatus Woesebacteria bacterium]
MYQPKFEITNHLLTYISSIESAKALIDHAALVPSWEAKFRDEAMIRSVHFGTHIEGNELTADQAEKVVQLKTTSNPQAMVDQTGIIARDRDIQEVINYRNVIAWIDQRPIKNKEEELNLETLLTLHKLTMQKLLPDEQIAVFREKQVTVRGAANGQVVFRPPVSVEVPFLIKDFFTWLNSAETEELHPIFKAAITHYYLVYIHPFVEGNGRTARAFATLVLYNAGYDFKRFFSLEEYFDSDVDAYYQALLSVQQSSDQNLTYWLEYFAYGLALEIDKVKQKVLKLSQDLKIQRELGQQVALSERQIILLEVLQNQGHITSDDAQKALPNVSVDTILRDLKDLINKGVVQKHGVTKGVSYTLLT